MEREARAAGSWGGELGDNVSALGRRVFGLDWRTDDEEKED